MAGRIGKICSYPGCPTIHNNDRGRCDAHLRPKFRGHNRKKNRWYDTKQWRSLRLEKLNDQPICEACNRMVATEVDHVNPFKSDLTLFLDYDNLQSICNRCHFKKTSREAHDARWHKKGKGLD